MHEDRVETLAWVDNSTPNTRQFWLIGKRYFFVTINLPVWPFPCFTRREHTKGSRYAQEFLYNISYWWRGSNGNLDHSLSRSCLSTEMGPPLSPYWYTVVKKRLRSLEQLAADATTPQGPKPAIARTVLFLRTFPHVFTLIGLRSVHKILILHRIPIPSKWKFSVRKRHNSLHIRKNEESRLQMQ